jgi:hypothetical protein
MKVHPSMVAFFFLGSACSGTPDASAPGPEVRRILEDPRYEWVTLETENTRIHFPAGSYAESISNLLPGQAERARRDVLDRLSLADYPHLLHLFYVDSREDVAKLTGSPATGYSYSHDRAAVLVVHEDWRAFERHELTHTVTLGTWTHPAGPAVVEGLATYVEGTCGGYDNGRITRTFLDGGSLFPLETLTRDFRGQDDLIAYLQAGSTIEFVVESGGAEFVNLLWEQGLRASPTLLGMSPAAFQREFEEWIRSAYTPIAEVPLHAIRTGGCGVTAPGAG